ncbi:hypothetical protein PFICI_10905 [Pestalotiopsis fici W106-1]|uniref:C2H2-type domain-containing protein n=1 Tax=Pestalotiopsis fici (strain W106-1 / CGMCC3.15140) TaxID=1229662 RepID=W3WW00_PESFW|nr:uncharacterized protein PFICI_10905 [Pestalotiopsis fici W106-1]ETS77031.1 hypothetical protein PFICI_10905 [Pestalotiopsis fici W106-1]
MRKPGRRKTDKQIWDGNIQRVFHLRQIPITPSLVLPCIGHKRTGIQEWLGSVEQGSCVKSSAIGSPSKWPDFDESSGVKFPAPGSDTRVSIDLKSEDHAPHDATPGCSLTCNTHANAAGSSLLLSSSSWLNPLLGHPLYSIIVQAWAKFWSEDPVDQDGSTGNTQQSATPAPSGSASDSGSSKRPSQGSKRKRKSDEKDGTGDSKRTRPDSDNGSPTGDSKNVLACHFYKMNPRQHLECLQRGFHNISALGQHLGKQHKLGPIHCGNCWTSFTSDGELRAHLPLCKPTGGIAVDHLPDVPKTRQDPSWKWYWIWRKLFPNFTPPDTPYTDGPEYQLIQQFVDFFSDRYAPNIASQLGSEPSLTSVVEVLRAAAREWASTPAHTLNFRPLPTPPTTISEDETRTSPAALQGLSENTNTYGNSQPTESLANGSDEGIAPSILLDNENLLNMGHRPTESLAEGFQVPTVRTDEINTANNATTYTVLDSRTGMIAARSEEENTSAWSPEQAFVEEPSNEIPSEDWIYAGGLTEEEDWMQEMNYENLGLLPPSSSKDMDEPGEHLEDSDDEDQPLMY